MDNASVASIPASHSHCADHETVIETDAYDISYALSRAPSTPTKTEPTHTTTSLAEQTPRPLHAPNNSAFEKTPRPTVFSSRGPALTLGFTLSYLRRVPELSAMAYRVVKAEAKRRAREERKLKVQTQENNSAILSSSTKGTTPRPDEAAAPKMKRLFQWAIVKLYEEGSVVLWDGAVRPLASSDEGRETNGLWKVNITIGADSTSVSFGTSSGATSRVEGDEDEGEISDPAADEEAYISLTPAHLAPHVEKAINTLMARSRCTANTHTNCRIYKLHAPAPPPGPTKEEITKFLQRMDGRWARVGEWTVDDALRVLQKEDKVWCVGQGRWELCL